MPFPDIALTIFSAKFLGKEILSVIPKRDAVIEDSFADQSGLGLIIPEVLVAEIGQEQKRDDK